MHFPSILQGAGKLEQFVSCHRMPESAARTSWSRPMRDTAPDTAQRGAQGSARGVAQGVAQGSAAAPRDDASADDARVLRARAPSVAAQMADLEPYVSPALAGQAAPGERRRAVATERRPGYVTARLRG
jgi:hypothetical protein